MSNDSNKLYTYYPCAIVTMAVVDEITDNIINVDKTAFFVSRRIEHYDLNMMLFNINDINIYIHQDDIIEELIYNRILIKYENYERCYNFLFNYLSHKSSGLNLKILRYNHKNRDFDLLNSNIELNLIHNN